MTSVNHESTDGFSLARLDAPDTSMIRIIAPDGRSSAVYIEEGVLVHRGDLPSDEASKIFLESMSLGLQTFTALVAERDALLLEVAELRAEVDTTSLTCKVVQRVLP